MLGERRLSASKLRERMAVLSLKEERHWGKQFQAALLDLRFHIRLIRDLRQGKLCRYTKLSEAEVESLEAAMIENVEEFLRAYRTHRGWF